MPEALCESEVGGEMCAGPGVVVPDGLAGLLQQLLVVDPLTATAHRGQLGAVVGKRSHSLSLTAHSK